MNTNSKILFNSECTHLNMFWTFQVYITLSWTIMFVIFMGARHGHPVVRIEGWMRMNSLRSMAEAMPLEIWTHRVILAMNSSAKPPAKWGPVRCCLFQGRLGWLGLKPGKVKVLVMPATSGLIGDSWWKLEGSESNPKLVKWQWNGFADDQIFLHQFIRSVLCRWDGYDLFLGVWHGPFTWDG